MGDARASFDVSGGSGASFESGTPASAPSFEPGRASGPAFELGVASGPSFEPGVSSRPEYDVDSAVAWTAALGPEGLVLTGTGFRVAQGHTVYFAAEGQAPAELEVAAAALAMTVEAISLAVDQDPGAGQYVLTLRKNKSDTAMQIVLTGAGESNRKGICELPPVQFDAEDWFSLKAQVVAPAPDAAFTVFVKPHFAT